jgi:hypothetical protein
MSFDQGLKQQAGALGKLLSCHVPDSINAPQEKTIPNRRDGFRRGATGV